LTQAQDSDEVPAWETNTIPTDKGAQFQTSTCILDYQHEDCWFPLSFHFVKILIPDFCFRWAVHLRAGTVSIPLYIWDRQNRSAEQFYGHQLNLGFEIVTQCDGKLYQWSKFVIQK
jgi:hypothetical protein